MGWKRYTPTMSLLCWLTRSVVLLLGDCGFGCAIEIAVITSKSALLTEAIVLKISIIRAR